MQLKLPAGHFLGETIRTREVSGLRLTETIYQSGLKLPKHSHELAKYCFVLAGQFTETVGKLERVRLPLTLLFNPEDTTHQEVHDAPGHHFLVEVSTHWIDRVRKHSASLASPVDLASGTAVRLATTLYDEFRHTDELSPLVIEGLMLELLAETSRRTARTQDRRPPYWLERITERLRASFAENLTLKDLATEEHVHEVHLARVFRTFHGCTIGEYVRGLRVEYASRHLSTTDQSLAEIAAASGFADQSHFSRIFKAWTRLSPSEFRAVFRKNR